MLGAVDSALNQRDAPKMRALSARTRQWRDEVIRGPSERDIVYSGLSDTMSTACAQTRETAEALGVSFRMAAYVNALRKIHVTYEEAGLLMA